MDSDAIFLVDGETLLPLVNEPYATEARLQEFLARFPELIAGGQIDPDAPRRWVLVGREVGIPDREGGHDRWSLDHLILDQDAVPTVVEVKRSTDTRIRREVVGQMLDYAANGVLYWPIDALRSRFEANHDHPEEVIAELTGDQFEYDGFWDEVASNLRKRRVRLVWVADVIPTELRTIIEYLNEELTHAEAFAVEIRQYVGGGRETLVPTVLGMSATQRIKKRTRGSNYRDNLERASEATRQLADRFWHRADRDERVRVAETKTGLKMEESSTGATLLLIYPQWDSVQFSVGPLWDAGLEEEAQHILAYLTEVTGEKAATRSPAIPAATLLPIMEGFIDNAFAEYLDAHVEAYRRRHP